MSVWLNKLLASLYALLAIVLIGTGLYVSVGRELVPWVQTYHDEVETLLSAQFKHPVSIAKLSGRWQGLGPVIELEHVTVEADEPLSLNKISLYPNLWKSLLTQEWVLKEVSVEGLHLVLKQSAQGAWALVGLPSNGSSQAPNWPQLIEQSKRLQQLSLVNSQISLVPHQTHGMTLRYADIRLQNGLLSQRMDARAILPDGKPISLNLTANVDPQTPLRSKAALYVNLPHTEWSRWLPRSAWQVHTLEAGAEVWLDVDQGAITHAAARVYGKSIKAHLKDQTPVVIEDLRFTSSYTKHRQSLAAEIAATINGERFTPAPLAASFTEDALKVNLSTLELRPLLAMTTALVPLPDKPLQVLKELSAKGRVHDLAMRFSPNAPVNEKLYFSALLEDVSTQPTHGAPLLDNVTGKLVAGLTQGTLWLDSQAFGMHLTRLFAKPWHYQKASGRISWHLDNHAFSLKGRDLALEGHEGQLFGDFMIRLRRDRRAESYMDLRVGMRQGNARFTEQYLPLNLNPNVSQWLTQAIQSGDIQEGFFQYQGALRAGMPREAKSVSLYFDVTNAQLNYLAGWPALTQADAKIWVDAAGVRVNASNGQILHSKVQNVAVSIAHAQAPRLMLTGDVQSTVSDALAILTQTPLATKEVFSGWHGEGAVLGAINLDIPLSKQPNPAHVVVDFSVDNASVTINRPQLRLEQVKGTFEFDNHKGLRSEQVTAKVLGETVSGSVKAIGSVKQPASRLDANGHVQATTLAKWLGVTQPLPVEGMLNYDLALTLDGADSQLLARSNLQGITLNLPKPLGKDANEVKNATWRMTLSGEKKRYWLDVDQTLSLALEAPKNVLQGRGELRLGAKAQLPTEAGFWVKGDVSSLDFGEWQKLYTQYVPQNTQGGESFFKGARLNVERFTGFGLTVPQLKAVVSPVQGMWSVTLDSPTVKGYIGLAANKPIVIDLDHLKLPAPSKDKDPEAPDPLAGFEPSTLPAFDLAIGNLHRGSKALGHVRLKLRPYDKGAALSDIDLDLMGLGLKGAANWSTQKTDFIGQLSGKDLSEVLLAWDYAPSISSQHFTLEADGQWEGSPLHFALKRYSGSMTAALVDGQLNEVQGGASALRIFGLLNFSAIGRRLRLDFSDLLGKGLSYDRFDGVLYAKNGVFETESPLTLEGPSTNLELKGTLDMVNDELNAKLLVALPLTNNLPLASLMIGVPAIGGALFVVDKLLGNQVSRFASVQYDITGSLAEPKFSFDKPFEKAQ